MWEATASSADLVVRVEAAEWNMSALRHRVMIMSVEQAFFKTRASQTRLSASRLSDIQKHPRFPAALRSLDREIVKRHRFHVRALMMPFRIERFALGRCFHEISFISLGDFHFSHAQQQTLGV